MGQTSAIPFRSSQGVMSSWSEGEESPQLLITTIWICLMLPPCRGWLSAQGEVTSPPCRQDKQACVSPAQVSCLSPWPPCTLRRDTRNDTVVLSYKYRDRRFRHSPFCSLTESHSQWLLWPMAWVMVHSQLQQTPHRTWCIASNTAGSRLLPSCRAVRLGGWGFPRRSPSSGNGSQVSSVLGWAQEWAHTAGTTHGSGSTAERRIVARKPLHIHFPIRILNSEKHTWDR